MMSGFSDPLLHLTNGLADRASIHWKMDDEWLKDKGVTGKHSVDGFGLRLKDGAYFARDEVIVAGSEGTLFFWITWNGINVELLAQRERKQRDTRVSTFCLAIKDKWLCVNGKQAADLSDRVAQKTSICYRFDDSGYNLFVDGEMLFEDEFRFNAPADYTRFGYAYQPLGLDWTLGELGFWNEVFPENLVKRVSSIGHF